MTTVSSIVKFCLYLLGHQKNMKPQRIRDKKHKQHLAFILRCTYYSPIRYFSSRRINSGTYLKLEKQEKYVNVVFRWKWKHWDKVHEENPRITNVHTSLRKPDIFINAQETLFFFIVLFWVRKEKALSNHHSLSGLVLFYTKARRARNTLLTRL